MGIESSSYTRNDSWEQVASPVIEQKSTPIPVNAEADFSENEVIESKESIRTKYQALLEPFNDNKEVLNYLEQLYEKNKHQFEAFLQSLNGRENDTWPWKQARWWKHHPNTDRKDEKVIKEWEEARSKKESYYSNLLYQLKDNSLDPKKQAELGKLINKELANFFEDWSRHKSEQLRGEANNERVEKKKQLFLDKYNTYNGGIFDIMGVKTIDEKEVTVNLLEHFIQKKIRSQGSLTVEVFLDNTLSKLEKNPELAQKQLEELYTEREENQINTLSQKSREEFERILRLSSTNNKELKDRAWKKKKALWNQNKTPEEIKKGIEEIDKEWHQEATRQYGMLNRQEIIKSAFRGLEKGDYMVKSVLLKKIQAIGQVYYNADKIAIDGIWGEDTQSVVLSLLNDGELKEIHEQLNIILKSNKDFWPKAKALSQKLVENQITGIFDNNKRRAQRERIAERSRNIEQKNNEIREKEKEESLKQEAEILKKEQNETFKKIAEQLDSPIMRNFETSIREQIGNLQLNGELNKYIPLDQAKRAASSFLAKRIENRQNTASSRPQNSPEKEGTRKRTMNKEKRNQWENQGRDIVMTLITGNGTRAFEQKLQTEWKNSKEYQALQEEYTKGLIEKIKEETKKQAIKTAEDLLKSQGISIDSGEIKGNVIRFYAASPGGERIFYDYNIVNGELSVQSAFKSDKTAQSLQLSPDKKDFLLQLPTLEELLKKGGDLSKLAPQKDFFNSESEHNEHLRNKVRESVRYNPGVYGFAILKEGKEKNEIQHNIADNIQQLLEINNQQTINTNELKWPYEILLPICNSSEYFSQHNLKVINEFTHYLLNEKHRVQANRNQILEKKENKENMRSTPQEIMERIFHPELWNRYQKEKNFSQSSSGIWTFLEAFESDNADLPGSENRQMDIEKIKRFMNNREKNTVDHNPELWSRYDEMQQSIDQFPQRYNKEIEEREALQKKTEENDLDLQEKKSKEYDNERLAYLTTVLNGQEIRST